ncbi:ThiF family adenylyltransferase [Chromobacterium violaceum]|uniref:ThiF family adenylyltransferase n=1 Tax=Chromobacterium violaceum TaxID=536 RepID=UPI0009BA5002|nr:ThiF family adenylyltransferase [Chromobacterium violaceum]
MLELPDGMEIKKTGEVLIGGESVGLTLPVAQIRRRGGKLFVHGKNGIRTLSRENALSCVADLVSAGVVLLGKNKEVEQIINLLNDPKYSRTISYLLCISEDLPSCIRFFEKINSGKVIIIGCGGIGSLVAYLLAGSGIRELCLIDPDLIEESNINRQIFWTRGDVGQKKVDVLKSCLESRFGKSLKIEARYDQISGGSIESLVEEYGYHAVVITADSPVGIHIEIAKALEANPIHILGGGYTFSTLTVYEGAEWISSAAGFDAEYILDTNTAPSFGPINAEIASIISNRAIQKIAGMKQSENIFCSTRSEIFPRVYF